MFWEVAGLGVVHGQVGTDFLDGGAFQGYFPLLGVFPNGSAGWHVGCQVGECFKEQSKLGIDLFQTFDKNPQLLEYRSRFVIG